MFNKSREDAIRFYRDFLGFEITKEIIMPREPSEQVFTVSREIPMIAFEKDGIREGRKKTKFPICCLNSVFDRNSEKILS